MASNEFYQDAETGELIPADEVESNPGLYQSDSQPEGSWWSVPLSGLLKAGATVGTAAGGLGEAASDALGADTLGNWFRDTRERGQNTTKKIEDYYNYDPGSAKAMASNTIAGVLPMVPALATGMGAAPLLATLGAQEFGDRYGQFRQQGEEPLKSAFGAGAATGLDTLINMVPVNRLLNPTSGFLRKTAENAAINTIANPASLIANLGVDAQVTGAFPTEDQFNQALDQTVKQGLMAAPVNAAVATLGQRYGTKLADAENAKFNAETDRMAQDVAQLPPPESPPPSSPPGPTEPGQLPWPQDLGDDFTYRHLTQTEEAISRTQAEFDRSQQQIAMDKTEVPDSSTKLGKGIEIKLSRDAIAQREQNIKAARGELPPVDVTDSKEFPDSPIQQVTKNLKSNDEIELGKELLRKSQELIDYDRWGKKRSDDQIAKILSRPDSDISSLLGAPRIIKPIDVPQLAKKNLIDAEDNIARIIVGPESFSSEERRMAGTISHLQDRATKQSEIDNLTHDYNLKAQEGGFLQIPVEEQITKAFGPRETIDSWSAKTIRPPVKRPVIPERARVIRWNKFTDYPEIKLGQTPEGIATLKTAENQIVPIGESETAKVFAGPKLEVDKLVEAAKAKNIPAEIEAVADVKNPIRYVKAKEIAVRPKVMQWRTDIEDPTSGTRKENAIAGPWDEGKAGILILWEPRDKAKYGLSGDEKYVLADGHHRLKGGLDRGVEDYAVKIIREADGYTDRLARAYAAEVNIAQGRGNVNDTATWFREIAKEYGRDEAINRAKNLGTEISRNGKTIGLDAENDVYLAFKQTKIDADQALLIAKVGAGNPDVQREGLRAALKGKRGDDLKAEMLASQGETETDPARRKAKVEAIKILTKDLKTEKDVLSSAKVKDLENVTSLVKVTDREAALQRADKIKGELKDWANWSKFADLRKLVSQKTDEIYSAMPAAEKAGDAQTDLFAATPKKESRWNKERGAVVFPFGPKRSLKEAVNDYLTPEGVTVLDQDMDRINQTSIQNRYFRGRLKSGQDLGILSDVLATYRKAAVFPKTVAEKFPEFRPVFETALDTEKFRNKISSSLVDVAKPYFQLEDKTRVNKALIAARKSGAPVDDAVLKNNWGLSDPEIGAYKAVRNAMDASFEILKNTFIAKGHTPEKAQAFVDALKTENYVPFSRFGNLFVAGYDKNSNLVHFSLHENKAEYAATRERLNKQGISTRAGEVLKPSSAAYEGVPVDLMGQISQLDPEAYQAMYDRIPVEGFAKHMLKAKLTPGFDQNLERSIAEYITGLSNYAAHKQAEPIFRELMGKIDVNNKELHEYASRYVDYVNTSTPEMQKLRQFYALYYLGGNVKSAAVNLTQSLTTTYPLLAKYVKNPAGTIAMSMRKGFAYMNNPEAFTKTNPELSAVLNYALKEGVTSEQQYRDVSGLAKGIDPKKGKLVDGLMFAFDKAEKYNRSVAMIAGWEAGKTQGLRGPELMKFAERFVEDTQFIYSKANRPEMARGKLAPLFTFRLFAGNWIRLLRNNPNMQTGGRMLGAMIALGGLSAIPLMKETEKALEAAGHDPKKSLREILGNGSVADTLIYGLPTNIGLNVSGAIGFGELAPEIEQGIGPAAARLALGVAADIPQRIGRAAHLLNDMDSPQRAAEAVLPESLRNIAVAGRAAMEGFRTPKNEPLVEDPTVGELIGKALGFTPQRLAKAYEEQHTYDVQAARGSDSNNYNFKIAKAIFDGKQDKARNYALMAAKDGHAPNPTAIKMFLLGMKSPAAKKIKSAPKGARPDMVDTFNLYQ